MELKKMIDNGSYSDQSDNNSSFSCDLEKAQEEEEQKKNEMQALWKDEINDIGVFLNNLNSIKTTLVR